MNIFKTFGIYKRGNPEYLQNLATSESREDRLKAYWMLWDRRHKLEPHSTKSKLLDYLHDEFKEGGAMRQGVAESKKPKFDPETGDLLELDPAMEAEREAYLQSGSELDVDDKPYLTAEEARKKGVFLDRAPDPEPGTDPPRRGMKTGTMMNEPMGEALSDPSSYREGRQPSFRRLVEGHRLNEKSITKSKSQSRRPVVGKYGGRYGSMGRNKDSVGMVGRGTSSPEPAENPNLIQITAENWESLGMPQDAIGAYVRKVEGTSKGPYHTVDQMLNKIFKASKKGGEVKVVNTGIYGNIGPENNPPKERYGPAVGGATKDKATTPYTDEKGEKESSLEDNDGDGGGDGGE